MGFDEDSARAALSEFKDVQRLGQSGIASWPVVAPKWLMLNHAASGAALDNRAGNLPAKFLPGV